MRIYILVLIVIIFGLLGFEIKRKYVEQKQILLFLKTFIEYLKLNITLYKSDISEIINNYIIMQNNKNAKYVNLFLKNNNLTQINIKNIRNNILCKDLKFIIESYFFNLGKENIDGENKKAELVINILNEKINKSNEEIKLKGDLSFKIILSLGIVLVIILW
jgi:hypothetical protein